MAVTNITSNVTIISDTTDEISGPYSSHPARQILQDATSDIIIAHLFLTITIVVLVILQGITNKTNRKHELVIFMHKRHKKTLRNRARVKDFLLSTDFEQTFSCRNDDVLPISYITLQIPVKAPFKPMKVSTKSLSQINSTCMS